MMMKKRSLGKSFDGNDHQIVSRINGGVLAAAVLLLTAALLCGAAAAEAGYFDTSGFATGYVEPEKPLLLPMDTESIAANSEPDLEMNKRFPDAGQRKSSGMQSNVMMAKSLQNSMVETYPEKFDLRENSAVTSVKDQGDYGTCWAFASIAAIESNTIMHGYETAASADFSEAQLAYFTYNRNGVTKGSVPPVFSRLAGDDIRITSSVPFYDFGGNSVNVGHTLMAGIGVARESDLPYSQLTSTISPAKAYTNNEYTAVGTYIISASDKNLIKSQLMHTGCGVIYYYAYIDAYGPNSDGSYSFYNPEKISTNHAVALVGWDDTYPIENFDPANRPANPGAWLIKNSWGLVGQDGYFWISYEDKSLNEVTFFEVVPSDDFDTIYQYDGGVFDAYFYGAEVDEMYLSQFANQFVADANQWITAAAFELFDTDLSSDLYVEVTVWNSTDEFYTEYQLLPTSLGYYYVSLPIPVYVSAGETFGVDLYVESSSPVYVGADVSAEFEDIEYVSCNLDKQSFWFNFDDKYWYYYPSDEGVNCRIKAYGVNAESPVPSMLLLPGWNFVSVPKKLSAAYDTAEELFGGVNTSGKVPLFYNAETKGWEQVNASSEIKPLNAYWIYSAEEMTITPEFDSGVYVLPTKKVYEGWNGVGLSAGKPMAAASVFNNIAWRAYSPWNAAEQAYGTPIIKGGEGESSDRNPIYLWKGGWVYMDADATYIGYA